MQPIYDPDAVRPMWEEIAQVGVQPVTTPEEVERLVSEPEGTTLLFINSVCGCAAGHARPGLSMALQHCVIPDRLATVFAGVDRAAVNRVREFMPEVPPSSPFVALFKGGRLVFALQRSDIEGADAQQVATSLTHAFDKHCGRTGPSVPRDVYEKVARVQQCGSSIPFFRS